MNYIDGFVIPVPASSKDAYVALAKTMAAIFVEYGAIRVVEGWGDDIKPGKINDFRTATIAEDAETVAFSWTEWPSKLVRDVAHEKIMADPRMPAVGEMPFDGKRMIFGGFTPVLDTANQGSGTMATRTNGFIWYELLTTDIEAASRFYGAVVGWAATDSGMPGMDYRLWSIGGANVGGLMTMPKQVAANTMRPTWLGYIAVADADASVAGVTAAGGAVHMPPTDIPGVGRVALVADPQGAPFYVMDPTGMASAGTEPSPAFAPGKPGHGGWHELRTTDWEAALAFYGAQFGWAKSEALDMGPMGKYLLFNTGGDAVGGMMNGPDPRPSWLYYFNVEDIDAAKLRVEQAGGVVVSGPHAVPGGGWIIQARDPQDALFALVGPRKAGG